MQENCGYSRKRLYKYLIELVIDPMPKLSVIVPVYNTEKYLRECVDSILAQTFTDFELILVDDGSTDSSGAICDEYAGKDPRIQVIHQKNGGITVARKSGVRAACGEYVTFVDSDDWIEQEMYAIMLDCGQEAAPDVMICGMLIETSKGIFPRKEIIKAGFYDKNRMQQELYPIMLFDFAHCAPAVNPSLCNKLFKKQLLGNIIEQVNDTITYGEDALCTYSGLLDADGVYITDRNMYHYRNHAESVCNTYSCSLLEKFSLLIKQLQSQFQQRDQCMLHQLYGYTARHALECIRSELLYNNGISYWKKRSVIVDFLSAPFMWESISYAISKVQYSKTKVKLFLCQKRYIEALYIGYLARNFGMLREKGAL